nr:hypothetical protein Iba_chr12cCG14410 [Ipomoea batatas]
MSAPRAESGISREWIAGEIEGGERKTPRAVDWKRRDCETMAEDCNRGDCETEGDDERCERRIECESGC